MNKHPLSRTELIVGTEGIEKLKNSKVIVFGIGGVGSFATEALARAGVGNLVLVDNDTVDITNLNRQIHATLETVGKAKVELMKERILSINPNCNVTTIQKFILEENIPDIIPMDVDYVLDAIDTISTKLGIAEYCTKNNINIISSMGTGNKMDPTRFKVTDVYKTAVCPLAKVMRHELKKRGVKKLKVVFSDEIAATPNPEQVKEFLKDNPNKRQIPGSISFVPPVAGMILGGEVIKDILKGI